MFKIAPKLD